MGGPRLGTSAVSEPGERERDKIDDDWNRKGKGGEGKDTDKTGDDGNGEGKGVNKREKEIRQMIMVAMMVMR